MNTLNGYSKSTLTDNFVLSAAGGHLAVGNASGNIPLNNGTVNTNLNADKVGGYTASSLLEGAYKVSGAISVSSAGWYKIAAYSTTGYLPRGSVKFIISTTGGSYTPGTVEFYGDMSWSWTDTFYSFGYNPYGLKVRFGKDANYTYIEVYFSLAISSSCYLYVPYSASSMSIQNNAWTWYTGVLSASVATSYSGSTNGASGFVWGTNMYAAHFYENSDITLKTNITEITSSDNIPQLKSFDWKSDGTRGYGLIAQELEEMGYPELVSGEEDGTKTVNYSAALSLIVGKLQVKIRELEKEIENLKNKN